MSRLLGHVGFVAVGTSPNERVYIAGLPDRLDQTQVIRLIKLLKEAQRKLWPALAKPLCPSSAAVLSYLRKHTALTPLKAREELDVQHLARRIKDLKEHGHEITTTYETSERGKRYARYSLVKSASEGLYIKLRDELNPQHVDELGNPFSGADIIASEDEEE